MRVLDAIVCMSQSGNWHCQSKGDLPGCVHFWLLFLVEEQRGRKERQDKHLNVQREEPGLPVQRFSGNLKAILTHKRRALVFAHCSHAMRISASFLLCWVYLFHSNR